MAASSGILVTTGGAAGGVLQGASKKRQLGSVLERKTRAGATGRTLLSGSCTTRTSWSSSAAILRCVQLSRHPNTRSFLLGPGSYASLPRQIRGERPSRFVLPRASVSPDTRRASSGDASLAEEATTSQQVDYFVRIETSRSTGSSLSRPEGGIMVALLGPAGKFVLRKLDTHVGDAEEDEGSQVCCMRGSFDIGATAEAHFRGPSFDSIERLWLSPVSGTWRPAAASVLVKQAKAEAGEIAPDMGRQDADNEINQSKLSEVFKGSQSSETFAGRDADQEADLDKSSSMLYLFKWNETLIGEGCEESAAQLDPAGVHTEDAMNQLTSKSSGSMEELAASRAAGLAEYQELKWFLLGTTAALVGVGTLGSKLAFGDEVGVGFAAGGLAGLLYLLLLERTVDQLGKAEGVQATGTAGSFGAHLEPQESSSNSESLLDRILNKVALIAKGPASRLILVALLGLVAVKSVGGSEMRNIEPRQILGGLVGFLVYKLAVLSAAFRPTNRASNS